MQYPQLLEGIEAVEGGPLSLWAPDKIVEEAEVLLRRGSKVLDVGAGRGTNGTYLAMQGHEVLSLEINPDYIENGRRIIKAIGSMALSNTFIEADMVNLDIIPEIQQFDAVIATRSLQLVEKTESYKVVRKIQEITNPGGLNIIRAYIATKQQQAVMSHRAFFEPEELQNIYENAGWSAIKYEYDLKPLHYSAGKPECQSAAGLITKKPSVLDEQKRLLLRQAEYYRNSDVEYYNLLMEQIDIL